MNVFQILLLIQNGKKNTDQLAQEQVWSKTGVVNQIALAIYNRIEKAIKENEDFVIGIVLPDYPEGNYRTEAVRVTDNLIRSISLTLLYAV